MGKTLGVKLSHESSYKRRVLDIIYYNKHIICDE